MTSKAEASGTNEPQSAPREFAGRFAEVFLLTGFALAQPVFSDLQLYPEFFAAHGVHRTEMLGLVFTLSCAVPLAATALGAAVGVVSARAAGWVHAAVLGTLVGVAVLQPIAGAAGSENLATVALGFALLAAALASWASLHFAGARGALRFMAPFGLVFPVLFLASATAWPLVATAPASPFTGPPLESETPVVVVVLDELPLASLLDERNQIDSERYPTFAALADDAHWFRNATTVASSTGYAIGSLVAGRRVREPHSARRNNLFTLLSNGNGVLAYEASGENCPPEIFSPSPEPLTAGDRLHALLNDVRVVAAHRLVPRAWRGGLPNLHSKWRGFAKRGEAAATPVPLPPEHREAWRGLDTHPKARGLAPALAALHAGERPSLLYLHLMLPHRPFSFFPSGAQYGLATSVHGWVDQAWVGTQWQTSQGLQRHLMQVGYADRLLGLFLAELHEVGVYDDAMIVVTSDHGHSFQAGNPDRSLTPRNFADVLSVPLLIKRPNQHAGVVDDRNVETIDIVPTIAAELGVVPPWPVDGQAIFDPSLPPRPHKHALRLEFEKYDVPDLRYPTEALERVRGRTVGRIRSSFGRGNAGLTELTPSRASAGLLGRNVVELEVGTRPNLLKVELPTRSLLAAVDATRAPVPAHLIGLMEHPGGGTATAMRDLAIAINGRVEAITQTYPGDASWLQFAAMLPEDALKPGANDVEVFEIDYANNDAADSKARLALWRTELAGYSGPPPLRAGGK